MKKKFKNKKLGSCRGGESMEFKNYELKGLGEFLSDNKLSGKKSRMRTRFVKLLNTQLVEVIDKERIEMIKEYADKDSNGKLIFIDNDNFIPSMSELNRIQFDIEFNSLLKESFYIEENDSNKEMITTVAHVMLDSYVELSGEDALLYDQWCEKFEEYLENNK